MIDDDHFSDDGDDNEDGDNHNDGDDDRDGKDNPNYWPPKASLSCIMVHLWKRPMWSDS